MVVRGIYDNKSTLARVECDFTGVSSRSDVE
jgi:hypothetical protein